MKVSLNWLTDYVDVSALPVSELAELFTRIGLCTEEVIETDTDVVFDLEVTSNRPDCLGHIGVARELAAATGLELSLPDLAGVPQGPPPASELTDVQVLAPELCPRYTARVIRGVRVGPSPRWMVERLEAVGLRSINNVVDATNFVLLEYSQPLHAFDYDLLAEHRIVVRRAGDGEELVSIDGTRCVLNSGMLVIADAAGPVALAGIMGGLSSEINDKTVNVLIESARFDPLVTRTTSRALSIMTESSYRFERGVDPVAVETASLRACQLILETAGGELAEGVVDIWAQPYRAPKVVMRTGRCRALLGLDVDDQRQLEVLARLGLSPSLAGGEITCLIPAHRPDLAREVDLIEEVARVHGYEKIPIHERVCHRVAPPDRTERLRAGVRDVLSAAGFDEAITFSFVDDPEAALWGFEAGVRVDPTSRRTNNLLRPTVLPSLLRACRTNQDAGNAEVSLYELAAVFRLPAGGMAEGGLPDERVELGMVTQRQLPYLRGVLEAIVERATSGAELEVVPAEVAGLAEGASAELRLDGQVVGLMGLVAPAVLDYYDLERPYAAAALRFDALEARAGAAKVYRPLPKFPAIRRDLSLVVDEGLSWGQIAGAVGSVHQPAREGFRYVTTYRGKPLPAGKKSVTISLTYRSGEGTLRREQVDQMVAELVEALGRRLGAALRA